MKKKNHQFVGDTRLQLTSSGSGGGVLCRVVLW